MKKHQKSGFTKLDFLFCIKYNHLVKSCICKESGVSPERCRHRNFRARAIPLEKSGKVHESDEEEPGYLHIQRLFSLRSTGSRRMFYLGLPGRKDVAVLIMLTGPFKVFFILRREELL